MQLAFNKPYQSDFRGGSFKGNIERPYFLEKNNLHIDYNELLEKGIQLYGEEASSPQPTKSITEQYKLRYEWYFTLRENYKSSML